MKSIVCALSLLIAIQTAQQPPAGQGLVPRFKASGALQLVDEFVAREMRADRTPGTAVAIVSREANLMVSTYGFADLRARVPLTPGHVFEIGSISKSFTALALLQQRDARRFDPRAPISRYLPWFRLRSGTDAVTAHHLLTHTAGLPRDRDDVPSSLYQAAALADRAPGSPPGTHYAYSNVGYQVLGYALAAIAGRPYPDVIRDGILRPLGMAASDAQITHDTRLRLAVGYEDMYDDRPEHPSHPLVPATWLEYGAGDGSIVSNAEDMAAYVRMLLNGGKGPSGPLVSAESFALFTQRAVQTGEGQWYGYGMQVRDDGGTVVLAHAGGMVGYSSMLAANVTDGVGAIVLVNGPGSPLSIARFAVEVARAVVGNRPLPPIPPPNDPLSVPNAADYAGVYSGDRGSLRFEAAGTRLYLVHRGERLALERRGADRFFANHPDFALFLFGFSRGTDKTVVEVSHGETWLRNERYKGPASFTVPPAWSAYPGHYRTTHAWFNNFRIVRRRGQLWLVEPGGGERVLVPLGEEFALDEKESAERIRFDTVVDGAALRATLSGVAYYRSFTP
jgi:D-alanyl-D-alanine carboxypeptidase